MRIALYVAACLASLLIVPRATFEVGIANAAAILFEAAPFLLASDLLGRFTWSKGAIAYLGCGCGRGATARSLPAAAATALVFGPVIAIARVLAATLVSRRAGSSHACVAHRSNALNELLALTPYALVAALLVQSPLLLRLHALTGPMQCLAGAAMGMLAAPCALGAVALAAALHVHAPLAAIAFLCTAGIFDLRAFGARWASPTSRHDISAYALLAVALFIVAMRKGGALLHPGFTLPLAASAVAAMLALMKYRNARDPRAWLAPAMMLTGALISAPEPAYYATETTLAQAFPNERLTFTGELVKDGGESALVRYAITCCRADATPVVVRLARNVNVTPPAWLRVDGILVRRGSALALDPRTIERVPRPNDPFIYR